MTIARHDRVPVRNVGDVERFASAIAGGGLIAYGIHRRSWGGLAMAAFGSELIYRGVTGYCPGYQLLGIHTAERDAHIAVPYETGLRVEGTVVVKRPAADLYRYWRDLRNLPQVMKHIKSVQVLDGRRSRWVSRGPLGMDVTWDAEIHHEEPDRMIGWRSLPGSQVETAGSVRFRELPDGSGTEVHVVLQYNPPAGFLGGFVAKLLGASPERQIREDLQRFKELMEAGGPRLAERSARRWGAADQFREADAVQEASEESYPASDAPAWTQGRVGS